jgi:hypothetical protein
LIETPQLEPRFNVAPTQREAVVRNNLEIVLDIPLYEQWLDLRLDEMVVEARQAEKRAARRRKKASSYLFPFKRTYTDNRQQKSPDLSGLSVSSRITPDY